MSEIAFDTDAFVKRLKAVGFTEEQADVFTDEQVRLIEDWLATKRDFKELEQRLKEFEERLWPTGLHFDWEVCWLLRFRLSQPW